MISTGNKDVSRIDRSKDEQSEEGRETESCCWWILRSTYKM
jgi:hypothetical protein